MSKAKESELRGILINIIFIIVKFFAPPQKWLLTSRLKRYRATATGRKLRHAVYLCEELLNPFDDGHC